MGRGWEVDLQEQMGPLSLAYVCVLVFYSHVERQRNELGSLGRQTWV